MGIEKNLMGSVLDKQLLRNNPRKAIEVILQNLSQVEPIERPKLLNKAAWCYIQLSDFITAKEYIDKSLNESKIYHDIISSIDSKVMLSMIDYHSTRYDSALLLLQESLNLYKELDHEEGIAVVLQSMARVYRLLGDFSSALQLQYECLTFREKLGDEIEIADAYTGIGLIHQSADNLNEAIAIFLKALSIYEKLDDQKGCAMALGNLGACYEAKARYKEALKNFEKALPAFERSGDQKQIATTLCNIGLIYSATNEKEKAIQYISDSLQIRRKINNRFGILISVLALHECYKENGVLNGVEVLDLLLEAKSIAEEINAKKQLYRIHYALCLCYEATNNTKEAFFQFKQYHDLKAEVFNGESDKRVKLLQTRYKVEETLKLSEIERLKTIELANALFQAEEERKRAEEASRIKSEVLNIVAHDLQTPISSIVNFAWLLKKGDWQSQELSLITRIEQTSSEMLQKTVTLLAKARPGNL